MIVRLFQLRINTIALALATWDVVILYLSLSLGLLFSYAQGSIVFTGERFQWQRFAFVASIILSNFLFGLYRRQYLVSRKQLVLRQLSSLVFAFFAMTAVFYVARDARIWISAIFPALAVGFIGLYVGRIIAIGVAGLPLFERRILVLGAGMSASHIEALERGGEGGGFKCIGFIPSGSEPLLVDPSRLLRPGVSLLDLVRSLRADEIVVALDERRRTLPVEDLMQCRLQGVQITTFSTFMERERGRVEIEGLYPSWLIFTDRVLGESHMQGRIKRMIDILVSLVLLIFTWPVLLTAALAIYMEDRRPILYRQLRVGKGGQTFSLLKFRSMHIAATPEAQERWTAKKDLRITRVGSIIRRMRIDELPQIYNVLRGEMSLVGPRPEQPAIVADLSQRIPFYAYRHAVRPGITGWAQINFRYGATVEDAREKLEFDLFYIKNYSLALDALIMLQTLRVVLWAEGAR